MRFNDSRRFNSYVGHIKKVYGTRLQKIVVDAGFTCPNRDGTISTGGCTYCNNDAFHPSYSTPNKSISIQLQEGIEFHKKRYPRTSRYLAYFQPYSNTYAKPQQLERLYSEALRHPEVCGVVIGTRPDCVNQEVIELLADISKNHIVIVEYGVESIYDKTLDRINRGHNFATAQKTIEMTAAAGITQGAHFIFGLPGESREEMLKYASAINNLPLNSVKFHQLQIVKGSVMESLYNESPHLFFEWSLEEYINFFIEVLEQLKPQILIERFAGEVPPRFVSHTPWGLMRNAELIRLLEKRLEELDTFQSRLYNP